MFRAMIWGGLVESTRSWELLPLLVLKSKVAGTQIICGPWASLSVEGRTMT